MGSRAKERLGPAILPKLLRERNLSLFRGPERSARLGHRTTRPVKAPGPCTGAFPLSASPPLRLAFSPQVAVPMQFQVASKFEYKVAQRSTVILNVHALRTPSQEIIEEQFSVEPKIRCEEFLSTNNENRFVRLETGSAKTLSIRYSARVETHVTAHRRSEIDAVPISQLDRAVIPYLFPSRYCQSDRLGRLAWNKFGSIVHPYERVTAIADWIHKNVEYLRGSTNSETSAFDTVTQRAGVCRDFAHLGIAFCRALSIPARYFSGYAYQLQPPDFHACFEAYIGNRWYIFDGTRLAPLNGLVRISMGRDAADASIATVFGRIQLVSMAVSCDLIGDKFVPWTHRKILQQGLSLDG